MDPVQTAKAMTSENEMGGWLQRNRNGLLLAFTAAALVFSISYFLSSRKKMAQESAWDAISAIAGKSDAEIAEIEKSVAGTSAEPWLFLQLAADALNEENYDKAKNYLDRFDRVPNNPIRNLDRAQTLSAGVKARIDKYQAWKKQHEGLFQNPAPAEKPRAIFVTDEGEITVGLYPEQAQMAVENFVRHCKSGSYTGTRFYDIRSGFSLRAGEGTTRSDKTEDWQIDKLSNSIDCEKSPLAHFKGALSMYQKDFDGPCSDVQFSISLKNQFEMDDRQPVFGMIVSGFDVVEKIGKIESSYKDGKNLPSRLVTIKEVLVEE